MLYFVVEYMRDMNRRSYLVVLGTALTAGCSQESASESIASATPNGDGTMSLEEARHYLETEGVDVVEMSGSVEKFTVAFESGGDGQPALDQIGTIASVYADVVEDHDETDRCTLDARDQFGDDNGELYIKAGWAERWNAGEVSDRAYYLKVLETYEKS